ncbi:NmrA family NAD(P)-binding protein [Streptomyces cylindrosporus]|uniref:NmrA family NAD(P)-binding protein n=1 Tax=Streptomyces cylindrosporus TaxID=2927583 RepID=A0ABS9YM20_9ACTN|nr:NmrA family NAD(P)-binding protein [Streptomyces cylindrosporus]MCI3276886.1 NmrA family NAD(P)-binding protein [Streptomyces cylindrosporus]
MQHLVYSSVGGMQSQNLFDVERAWGVIDKWQIEQHIHDLGVPATILRPAGLMEDFTSPARFFQNGTLTVPWQDDLVMQLIAIDDIGALPALVLAKADTYLGHAMEITGDRLSAPQIAAALSKAADRPIPRTQVPLDMLWEHDPEVAGVHLGERVLLRSRRPVSLAGVRDRLTQRAAGQRHGRRWPSVGGRRVRPGNSSRPTARADMAQALYAPRRALHTVLAWTVPSSSMSSLRALPLSLW